MKTKSRSYWDFTLWPLLKLIWEPFSKKRSHFWHWQDFTWTPRKVLLVNGLKDEKDRQGFWKNLWRTNFGWKNLVIVEPTNYDGFYRIGFFDHATNEKKICSCLVKGKIALLVGPNDVDFFAVDKNYDFCQMRLIKTGTKKTLPKNIPLL